MHSQPLYEEVQGFGMKPREPHESRQSERKPCKIDSTIKYASLKVNCQVIDVSNTGVAIILGEKFKVGPGSAVTIENGDFGLIEGQVRWVRGNRIGVHFDQDTNTKAKMAIYFRNFHKDIAPTERQAI